MAQLRSNQEKRTKKSKAKAWPLAVVFNYGIISKMTCWRWEDQRHASAEFDKRIRVAKNERVWDNQIVLKTDCCAFPFADSQIIKKIHVTVPEHYVDLISGLENAKELSNATLAVITWPAGSRPTEAPEEKWYCRRSLAGQAPRCRTGQKKFQKRSGIKQWKFYKQPGSKQGKNPKEKLPTMSALRPKGHPPFKCWRRPDAKCSECNHRGNEAAISNSKWRK